MKQIPTPSPTTNGNNRKFWVIFRVATLYYLKYPAFNKKRIKRHTKKQKVRSTHREITCNRNYLGGNPDVKPTR